MVSVKLYVEGGGDSKYLHTQCREGFSKLLGSAGLERMPRIVAGGSRAHTYGLFCTACRDAGTTPVLLVDSEEPVRTPTVWEHLKQRDGWERPDGAREQHAHLMITCMESWLVADRAALRKHYGQSLHERALPSVEELETHPRDKVQQAIEDATRACGPRRQYRKGDRSFEVLGQLNASTLRQHAPSFDRLVRTLEQL